MRGSRLGLRKARAPHRLGWSLLLAWVFCIFYTDALGTLGGADATGGLASRLFYMTFPLAASVATLVVVLAAERSRGPVSSHASAFVLSPAICALGTPLLFAHCSGTAASAVLFGAGALLTGVGSGVMWLLWGQLYCTFDRDETELLAPASAVGATLVVIAVAHTPGWFGVALATALPALSGLCLILARQSGDQASHGNQGDFDRDELRAAHAAAAKSPLAAARTLGRTASALFACCAVTGVIGCFTPTGTHAGTLDATMAVACVLALAACSGASARAHGISATSLFRWACPVLVMAAGLPFWVPSPAGPAAAHGLTIAARLLFCTFTQMYFALAATRGRVTPTQAFGLGWVAVHLGDLVGVGGVTLASPLDGTQGFSPALALACAAVTCLACTQAIGRADEGVLRPFACQADGAEDEGAPTAQARPATTGAPDSRPSRIDELASACELTPREREVLALLAKGRSVPYIRDELSISKDTASTHVKHIYAKLGVHSRQELLDLLS